MKKTLSLILAAFSLFLLASCGEKAESSFFDFNFEMKKEDIAGLRLGDETSEIENEHMKSYIRKDMDFFKNEEVTASYTFDEETGKLMRTKYDVSKCSDKNIKKTVDYFDKKYKVAVSEEQPTGEYKKTTKIWEKDNIEITYIRMDGAAVQTSFYIQEKGDTENAD